MITKQMSIAIHVMTTLARKGSTTGPAIAAELKCSQTYVANIMRKLTESGYIVGFSGYGGGRILNVQANDITLANIVSIFINTDNIDGDAKIVSDLIIHNLNKITLSDFVTRKMV